MNKHQYLHLEANYVKRGELADYLEGFRIMRADNNVLLLRQFQRRIREHTQPALTAILQRGVKEGVFFIEHVETAAALVNHTVEFFQDFYLDAVEARGTDSAILAANRLREAMVLQYIAVDRLLGLPDGTTNFGWPEVIDEVMATRTPKLLTS